MKLHSLTRIAMFAAVLPATAVVYAFPFGPGPGYSGAPGEATCAACHGGGQLNTGGGKIAVNLTSYTPAAAQHFIVAISDASAQRWGFEASPRVASSNAGAGALQSSDANTQVVASGALPYVEHTLAGTRPGTTGSITFEFDWTAPAAGSGDVVFYIAANAANGNNQADPGDHIYSASFRLTEASAQQTAPAFAAGNAVVNGASFQPGISPGAWISILGTNLAAGTRTWRSDEIVNGKLPPSLDGVSVTVDNKPAAVYFISPTQLNVQAPDDNSFGPVEVKVTTPQGTATTTVTLQPVAPAFFMFDQANRKYIAALHADFSLLAPAGLIPNVASAPAKAGEIVLLYATGCGSTNPATPSGQVVTAPAPVDLSQVSVTIGNAPAQVLFAGVTGAGLWQLNVRVPATLPSGDAPVVVQVAGQRSPDGSFLAIE